MSLISRAAGASALAYAAASVFGLAIATKAVAAAQDYRFEAAGPPVKSGKRLVAAAEAFAAGYGGIAAVAMQPGWRRARSGGV
jgi:hypothetical protein